MTESLPDFEAQTAPEGGPPARKPRRKPTKNRSAQSAKPAKAVKPARKARGKIDKRTKAYRLKVGRVGKQVVRVDMRQAASPAPAPAPGQAQAVLAVLAAIAGYEPAVRREILAKAGMLA